MAQKPTTKPAHATGEIIIRPIETEEATFCVVGPAHPRLPGITFNRVNEKAQRELLFPRGGSAKSATLKHEPLLEYRASIYRAPDGPTLITTPGAAFKRGMMRACTDLPSANMSEIARLVSVLDEQVPIWGVPEMLMGIVRMADMKHTPDIRTWATLREWACAVTVSFVRPNLTAQAVANLLSRAGQTVGVGDGRKEKGHLEHGSFRLVSPDDADYCRIVADGGRLVQEAGMERPAFYDAETAELFAWFGAEVTRRKEQGDARTAQGGGKKGAKGARVLAAVPPPNGAVVPS